MLTPPPLKNRPAFCIVNTVSNQLFQQVRIPCLSKTANTKLTFQEKAPLNSFKFDVSTLSTATLYSSIQKPTARHVGQVRHEHAVHGNIVFFQSETNFFVGLRLLWIALGLLSGRILWSPLT